MKEQANCLEPHALPFLLAAVASITPPQGEETPMLKLIDEAYSCCIRAAVVKKLMEVSNDAN